MGPCMCGDLMCSSCGPAQGNHKCSWCGVWDMDGGCADREACSKAEQEAYAHEAEMMASEEAAARAYWEQEPRNG